jgi:hypothetical protein
VGLSSVRKFGIFIDKRARLYSLKSMVILLKSVVILPVKHGDIAGRTRLYCLKSMVILPEERGYIARRAWLYSQNSAVIFSEERGYIFATKIVAYLSCSVGREQFARKHFVHAISYAYLHKVLVI